MQANDRQVGGSHYKSEFQHWDLVIKLHLDYLAGCATKYIARHKKKNGRQDLEKSLHYIDKMIQDTDTCCKRTEHNIVLVERFLESNSIYGLEKAAITNIIFGDLLEAKSAVETLVNAYTLNFSEDKTGQKHPFGYDEKEDSLSPREDPLWK